VINFGGHTWSEGTAVIVCDHVANGSEVRTVQIDEDALCFQCGGDDDPKLAKVLCLDCVVDRLGLNDVPQIPMNHVAHREIDGSWSIERQPEEN
jgi:hypothetical protein